MTREREKLPMSAYYYGFDETGERAIDVVLSAVAVAGKSYHNTEDWGGDPRSDITSAAEDIQVAAHRGAQAVKRLRAELDQARKERDQLREALATLTDKWLCRACDLAVSKGGARELARTAGEVRDLLPEDTRYNNG